MARRKGSETRVRKVSPAQELAQAFVREVLERPWDWRDVACRRALGEAKRLLSRSKDPVTGAEVEGLRPDALLRAVKRAKAHGERVEGLHHALYRNKRTGRSWYEEVTELPPPPPVWSPLDLFTWLRENRDALLERGIPVDALLEELLKAHEAGTLHCR